MPMTQRAHIEEMVDAIEREYPASPQPHILQAAIDLEEMLGGDLATEALAAFVEVAAERFGAGVDVTVALRLREARRRFAAGARAQALELAESCVDAASEDERALEALQTVILFGRRMKAHARVLVHQPRALEMTRAVFGPASEQLVMTQRVFGEVRYDLGEVEVARSLQESALTTARAHLPEDHPERHRVPEALAATSNAQERFAQAAALCEEAWRVRVLRDGEDHPETVYMRESLVSALMMEGRWGEVLDHVEGVLQTMQQALPARFGHDWWRWPVYAATRVMCEGAVEDALREKAEQLRQRALAEAEARWRRALPGKDRARALNARASLGWMLTEAGAPERGAEQLAIVREVYAASPSTQRVVEQWLADGVAERRGITMLAGVILSDSEDAVAQA